VAYDAPDYQHVLWENGKPYWKTASGKKTFIPPLVAAQMRDDPEILAWAEKQGVKIDFQTDPETGQITIGEGGIQNHAAPGGSLFRERGQWNSEKGEWDRPINWSNIMAMGVGGAMAAPFIVPALAAAGTSGAAGSGVAGAGSIGVGETAAMTGLAGSGFGTGAGLGFSAIPASLGGAAAAGGAAAGGAAAGGAGGGAAGGAAPLSSITAPTFGGAGAAGGGGGIAGTVSPIAAPTLGGATSTAVPLASSPLLGTGAAGVGLPAGGVSGAGMAGAGGTASTLTTAGKIANAARGAGNAINQATSQARDNRVEDSQVNQTAQKVYETSLMDRAQRETDERHNANRDVYRSSYFKNKAKNPGPFSGRPTKFSPEYMQGLSDLEQQGVARLAKAPIYDSTTMKPLTEREIKPAGTLEKAGQWIGPTVQTIGTIAGMF